MLFWITTFRRHFVMTELINCCMHFYDLLDAHAFYNWGMINFIIGVWLKKNLDAESLNL